MLTRRLFKTHLRAGALAAGRSDWVLSNTSVHRTLAACRTWQSCS